MVYRLANSFRRIIGVQLVFAGVAASLMLGGLVTGQPAYAADANTQAVCEAIGSGSGCTKNKNSAASVDNIVATIINIFSVIIGMLATVMIMVSGYKYITSAGDSSKLASAKNTLIYALVGAVIVALAQTISVFVLSAATDVSNDSSGSTKVNTKSESK